jgi:hypothetical protein
MTNFLVIQIFLLRLSQKLAEIGGGTTGEPYLQRVRGACETTNCRTVSPHLVKI